VLRKAPIVTFVEVLDNKHRHGEIARELRKNLLDNDGTACRSANHNGLVVCLGSRVLPVLGSHRMALFLYIFAFLFTAS